MADLVAALKHPEKQKKEGLPVKLAANFLGYLTATKRLKRPDLKIIIAYSLMVQVG